MSSETITKTNNPTRNFVLDKLSSLFTDQECVIIEKNKVVENIERGIYNYTIERKCVQHNIAKRWDDNLFKSMYVKKAISVYANLKSDSYLNNKRLKTRLLEGEFKPHEIVYMDPQEQFPEHWKSLIDEKEKIEKALYEKDRGGATDQFKCSKCKKRECSYYELQTRSADEPMTIFVTCLNCGKRWRE